MIYEEKTVSSEKVFEGRIIKVKVDRVEMPDGSVATRELVEHPGGVGIVAITDKDEIILVEQYRKPLDKTMKSRPGSLTRVSITEPVAYVSLKRRPAFRQRCLTIWDSYIRHRGLPMRLLMYIWRRS